MKNNLTGRKFKCKGLKESNSKLWNTFFTIGKIYNEKHKNCFGRLIDKPTYALLLVDNFNNCPLIVDKDQFELVETTDWKDIEASGASHSGSFILNREDGGGGILYGRGIPLSEKEKTFSLFEKRDQFNKTLEYILKEYDIELSKN